MCAQCTAYTANLYHKGSDFLRQTRSIVQSLQSVSKTVTMSEIGGSARQTILYEKLVLKLPYCIMRMTYIGICRYRSNIILFSYSKCFWWSCLMHADCSSSRPQVDDTLRHAQWLSGWRSGWSHDAEVLSLWRHGQRRQSHGVHRKTYVNVRPWFISVLLLVVIRE